MIKKLKIKNSDSNFLIFLFQFFDDKR